ncbi:MAG: T9SS type A sorting domain-containing protein, partial [Gammaproteobacteria bacterium]|nr:T9SS type A sorting domain-containing protein [Gammaproteobacteria bacterium]NIW98394.1 T9SS type A sorting domain-containing protein [Phycisphaerae bacterium]
VQLEGVSPLRSAMEDVSAPVTNPDECDCTTNGPDGFDDLTLKFDTQDIVAALGPVDHGDEVTLTLTATLLDGTNIEGKDCVVIKSKGGNHKMGTSVSNENLPQSYELYQNHPNPFNPETEIRFYLPEPNHVSIRIYNIRGEEIRSLVDSPYTPGSHKIRWDGKDNNGNPVSSGIYLYQLQTNTFSQVRKMSLLR